MLVAAPQTYRSGLSKLGSPTVGVLFGVGYLLLSALIVTGLSLLRDTGSSGPQASAPPALIPLITVVPGNTGNGTGGDTGGGQGTAPETTDSVVNNLSSAPDTPSAPTGDYTQVTGPDNLMTEIPNGWQPVPSGNYEQANDPNDSGRFVRYGATAAPPGDLLSSLMSAEQTNPNIQDGYQRVQLTNVDYHDGDPAVDWEFEFVKAGVTRHVYSRYWEANGTEYFVYVSATADRWLDTQPIFTEMADTASP